MTAGATGAERLSPASESPADRAETTPTREVLREIARGGLAGLIVGILLAGVGGRLVMRLAALLVPGAAGSVTENGNVIGTITLGGTLGLVVFVGLLFGAVAGSLWVVISPWLPAPLGMRAILVIPIALGLGARGLVDQGNPDFATLNRDPAVIGSLVILVALFGPALALVDRWLDRRLPHPSRDDSRVVAGYALVTALGTILTIFIVLPLYLGSDLILAGVALLAVGLATLASWWLRIEGRPTPPQLVLVARAGLSVATIVGLAVTTRHVAGALGLG